MNELTLSNIVLNIYSSIQSHSPTAILISFISEIFELSNMIIIIDIIFNYKRNFINITYPLYFLSPVFYLEFFLNHFVKSNSINDICKSLNKEDFKNDQIFQIISEYLNEKIYNQNCFYNGKMMKVIILIIIILCFSIHIITYDDIIISYIKYVCSLIIYIFLKTINLVIFIIFNREIYLQLSDNYEKINYNFFIGLIFYIIFKIIFFIFMSLFFYAFFNNKSCYLHNQNYLLLEISIQELSSLLIILRLNLKYSIVIQSVWLFFLFTFLTLKLEDMILTNHSSKLYKYYLISYICIMSILFGRIISLLIIKYQKDQKVFKFLDFAIVILFFIVFIYLLYGRSHNFSLCQIDNYFKKKHHFFYYGIAQIYEPITSFFLIKYKQGKISGKEKEIIDIYIRYFKHFLFKSRDDFLIIGEIKDKLIPLFLRRKSKNSLLINDEEREKIIFDILIYFIKYFKKKIKETKGIFEIKVNELLNYYKIQLF